MSDDLDLVGRVRLDTSGLDSSLGIIGGSLGKIGALAAGAFAIDKVAEFGKAGIGVAADFQQTTIAFDTMLGSGQKAQAFLSKLRDFAAKTPFEFPELATAASSLVSVGVNADDVIPIMTSLGNATAGMGTGAEGVKRATVALQQMSDAGRITGEDLNQLRDAGIPVFDLLSAATGKSKEQVAALAQSGKLGKKELDQLFEALKNGKGLEKFNGLMDAQSKTLNGVISTLKDTLSNIAIDFITPYLPAMTNALQGFADLLQNDLVPALHKFVSIIGEAYDDLVGGWENADATIGPGVDGFTRLFLELGATMREVSDFITQAWDLIVVGFQNPDLPVAVDSIQGVFVVLGQVFRDIADFVQQHWIPILIGAGITLGLMVAPVTTVVAGLIYAYTHFQLFHDIVNVAISGVIAVIQGLADFSQEIWPKVSLAASNCFDFITSVIKLFTEIVRVLWSVFGDDIVSEAKSLFAATQDIFSGALKVIEKTIEFFLDVFNGHWRDAFHDLAGIVDGGLQIAAGIFKGGEAIFVAIVKGIGSAITAAATGLFDGIKDAFRAAINYVIDKWNSISFTTPKVHLPGTDTDVGGDKISVPQIPRLAKGGTALTDGFAIVGDVRSGNGELAYLRAGTTIDPRLPEIIAAAAGGSGGGQTLVNLTLEFHGPTDGDSVRDALPDLVDALRASVGKRSGS